MNSGSRKFLRGVQGTVIIAAFCLALLPNFSYGLNIRNAQESLGNTGEKAFGVEEPEPLEKVIGRVVNIFLTVIGTLFFVLLLYGGYLWMMARGETEKVTKAKGLIVDAIIGLIIVFSAFIISRFILVQLLTTAE